MIVSGIATAWFGLATGLAGAAAITLVLGFYERSKVGATASQIQISGQDWREIRVYLLPVLPSVMVYMAQDPLIYWFTAQRGGATAVAEVFALARIGAILALAGTFVYVVLTPRLARIEEPSRYLRALVAYLVGLTVLGLCAVLIVAIVPQAALWLIGQNYMHLERELIVIVSAVAVTIPTTLIVLSNRIRGWVALDPIMACLQLTLILGLCLTWDFSSTLNVVILSLTLATTASASAAIICLVGLFHPPLVLAKGSPSSAKTP